MYNICYDCGHVHEEYHRVWKERIQAETKCFPDGVPDIICCPKCDSTNIGRKGSKRFEQLEPAYKDGSKIT